MTSRERARVAALERRCNHLAERLKSWDSQRGDPDRSRAEAAALRWALRVIRGADANGILSDLENSAGDLPRATPAAREFIEERYE